MIDDKTNQMLIMFPIDKTRGLNRDKQQGRMLAHLIRTQRRQGKDFIRQIGYRWLAAQKDHFDAQPDQAYRHLDQNIDSAWTATNPDKSLRLAGPDEQDYVQWMTQQWIPPSPLLREAERQKTGIGARGAAASLLAALIRLVFWKLLETDEQYIYATNGQLIAMTGISKAQLKRLKSSYISRTDRRATVLEILVEVEQGHHDQSGRAVPGKFLIGDDFPRLAFPEEYPE